MSAKPGPNTSNTVATTTQSLEQMADSLFERKQWNEAARCYQEVLTQNPQDASSLARLGMCLAKLGKFEDAQHHVQKATQLNPELSESHFYWGNIYRLENKLEEAVQEYQLAIELDRLFEAAWMNLGFCHRLLGKYEKSLECYEQALLVNPKSIEAHFNLGILHLLHGDFEKGWREYEWRLQFPEEISRSPKQPLWQGENFQGRSLLVHAEQGYGDAIQWIRFLPMVKARGGKVLLQCQKALGRLFATVPGIDELHLAGEALPHFDLQIPIGSLPSIFRSNEETLPRYLSYLSAEKSNQKHWKQRLGDASDALRVGICWQGNSGHAQDSMRSIPLQELTPLASQPNVEWFSLQKLTPGSDLSASPIPMKNYQDQWADFADTAAMIEELDLVISVDTSVAHLAGALGKRTWILLPHSPEWRWMIDRDDSPWYPSAKLFRQPSAGDWASVLEEVSKELQPLSARCKSNSLANRAAKMNQEGNPQEAIRLCREALSVDPRNSTAHCNLGVLLFERGEKNESLFYLERAATENPNYSFAYLQWGNILSLEKAWGQAIEKLEKGIELSEAQSKEGYTPSKDFQNSLASAYCNLGICYSQFFWREKATRCFFKALELNPDMANVHNMLALHYQSQGEYSKALAHFDRAIELVPNFSEAIFNRGCLLLAQGNFDRGWKEYAALRQCAELSSDELRNPTWNGEMAPKKTVLLLTEQGAGDSIQFIRYAALVKSRVGMVAVECAPGLSRLFKSMQGVDLVIEKGQKRPPDCLHVPLLDLPKIFETTLKTIPKESPYLSANIEAGPQLRRILEQQNQPKIGLCWQGNPKHVDNDRRCLPPIYLKTLAEVSGVQFFSLQKGSASNFCTELKKFMPIVDLSAFLTDFAETAWAIEQLDLVISVDTSVTHLVGALGKPAWTLLPFNPDWRWLLDRQDSPWYPSMRLFRQKKPGDWLSVMEEVVDSLQSVLAARGATPR